VGVIEIMETYLNSDTTETDFFPHGTKPLLTSLIGDPVNQRPDKWISTVYVNIHYCLYYKKEIEGV
jgi:hypothetical protein